MLGVCSHDSRRCLQLTVHVEGASSEYEIPSAPPWTPFERVKTYEIPDSIFDQYNHAQISTRMGLFADLGFAYVVIDNCLYLWDYSLPNPELVGYESQPHRIDYVQLVKPKAGVFLPSITHLLVIATSAEILLVGLQYQVMPGGSKSVALFGTGLSTGIRGMEITTIAGAPLSGRIFFSSKADTDIYELTYQQEEKWFTNRCGKINQTAKLYQQYTPSIAWATQRSNEHVEQLIIDETREILYTLSSTSTIRAYSFQSNGGLKPQITKTLRDIYSNIAHMINQPEVLNPTIPIISISPIMAQEASKLHLVANTRSGCRIFLSVTSFGFSSFSSTASSLASMQVQHIRLPPRDDSGNYQTQSQPSNQVAAYQQTPPTASYKSLNTSLMARRYPPGYFFCFLKDRLFISAPDTPRIFRPQNNTPLKYPEFGVWLPIEGIAEDLGICSQPFSAASKPLGFGNELATQFDRPPMDFAVLTNTGVHIIRRKRLVDIFAALIRYGGQNEGLDAETKNMILTYGRAETLATALAVACGQASDTSLSRSVKVNDPEVLDYGRRAFIEYGGRPTLDDVVQQGRPLIETVRPSPRHEALSLYVSRLIRSIWKTLVAREVISPTEGLRILPTVPVSRLLDIQAHLQALQDFLDKNKSFIEGLSGPEALSRASTRHEEIALQAEHQALHSLVQLIAHAIEGISFVSVLFDEKVEEVIPLLSESARSQFKSVTFESLFTSHAGKELAKELVKGIVNRNIAKGANVDTIADGLRRRCGSFCSAEDVVIFKAQEQLKKAAEVGSTTDFGRNLLNESLRLFKQVSSSLSFEYLESAVRQYMSMQFFAGAIQLALTVAKENDRANAALRWVQEGRQPDDPRRAKFESRQRCYRLIQQIITTIDESTNGRPETIDGKYTITGTRKAEAYEEIQKSDDEVFQTDLFDWYLSQGQSEKLLEIESPSVIAYLKRRSETELVHADLLWKYYARYERFFDAADIQLALAQSGFPLSLSRRIEYLGKAKANASTRTASIGLSNSHRLMRQITDLLEVANIQDDLLHRLLEDERLTDERRPEVEKDLDGQIRGLSDVSADVRFISCSQTNGDSCSISMPTQPITMTFASA